MTAELPLSHVRISEQTGHDVCPLSFEIPCESGDFALVTVLEDSLLLSVDDADRTLPGPDGSPSVPTLRLTHGEARSLVRWLEWALRRPPMGAEA